MSLFVICLLFRVFPGAEYPQCIVDTFSGGRGGVLQRVFQAEIFPLELSERMVGEDFHLLHIAECTNELREGVKILVKVAKPRHKHMPYPHGLPDIAEIPCHIKNIRIVEAGDVFVTFGVDLLYVEKQQVGDLHKLPELGEERFFAGEWIPGGVNAGGNALLLRKPEQVKQEINLEQGFSAADGDTAVFFPVASVTQRFI